MTLIKVWLLNDATEVMCEQKARQVHAVHLFSHFYFKGTEFNVSLDPYLKCSITGN